MTPCLREYRAEIAWTQVAWVEAIAGVLAARAYEVRSVLRGATIARRGRGCSADEEEGQEGNQEPCSRGWMHGKSDL
jgi:hypothetical protein